MCKEAHDRFEYPWLVSRSVSVGGRGNNRKSDTDYRRYRDFSLVIATPSDTITWTTGDYEYQVSLHIRCLRYDTARSLSPSPHLWTRVRNRFPQWKSYVFLRVKDFHELRIPLKRKDIFQKNIYTYYFEGRIKEDEKKVILKKFEEDWKYCRCFNQGRRKFL